MRRGIEKGELPGVSVMLRSCIVFLGVLVTHMARAQLVDYSRFEELFGEPVTTSVTGSPQRASDVPGSMTIISAEEIRQSGARDLPGVLRHVTGVDVLQTTNDHAEISVRGYNQAFSPRLLVLVDGRQVYADYYGFTPWSSIPVELAEIRQIEIVRGPNSALFGFNAVGGVINIVTYGALDEVERNASLNMGTQSQRQGSVVAAWKAGARAGLRLSAGIRRSDDFSTPQAPGDIGSRRGDSRDSLRLVGGWRTTDKTVVDLEATHIQADRTELGPVYTEGFTKYDMSSVKAHVGAETGVGLIEATVYDNRILADVFPDVATSPFLHFDNTLTVAQVQSISKLATRHTLRASLEHREGSFGTTPVSGADIVYDVDAVGAMWQWQIAPQLTLTNALRMDRFDLGRRGSVPPGYPFDNADWDVRRTETSYNSGVVWHFPSGDTLRFVAARGSQLPSLFDLGGFLLQNPGFGFVTGVPSLRPSVVTSVESDWDRPIAALHGNLSVRVFRGRTRDVVAIFGGGDPAVGLLGSPANIGESSMIGAEIELSGAVGAQWHWRTSYAPLQIDDDFGPGFDVANTLVDFQHTAPHGTVDANIGWTRGKWSADAAVRYESAFNAVTVQGSSANNGVLVHVPAFAFVDARVGYRFDSRLELSISGQNLAHAEQHQTGAPAVERRIIASVSFSF